MFLLVLPRADKFLVLEITVASTANELHCGNKSMHEKLKTWLLKWGECVFLWGGDSHWKQKKETEI